MAGDSEPKKRRLDHGINTCSDREAGEDSDANLLCREYFGVVKSYNKRRGFGFITCKETEKEFGRDVYVSAEQVQLAFGTAPVVVGDVVKFRVQLSEEGFPKAIHVSLGDTFEGDVISVPSEGTAYIDAIVGSISSDALHDMHGCCEVPLHWDDCLHLHIAYGDRVSFCVPAWSFASGGEIKAKAVQIMSESNDVENTCGIIDQGEGHKTPVHTEVGAKRRRRGGQRVKRRRDNAVARSEA